MTTTSSTGIPDRPLPSVDNRPGLDALVYRVRTHAGFKSEMIRTLGQSVLRPLASASDHDPSLALLDAWATTLDVLTFYQERIANEGYLRTATERRSVQELGRAVGYELNPGVAAETYLAFTVEEGSDAPEKVIIEAGTRVQSVPGPGEQAQTFETVEKIEARPEWNALRPQSVKLVWPQKDDLSIYLKGINTGLKPGDGILIVGAERRGDQANENWDFRRLKTVEPDGFNNRTRVSWDEKLGHGSPHIDPAKESPEVYAFRLRAALFGHNAPDWIAMSQTIQDDYDAQVSPARDANSKAAQWPKFTIAEISGEDNYKSPYIVHLDSSYPQIRPDSWVILSQPDHVELYEVKDAVESARTNFTISSKTTRLKLKGENLSEFNNKLRETMVFAQSEKLEIAEAPLPDVLPSAERPPKSEGISKITLDRRVDGLHAGMNLLITGVQSEGEGISSELVSLVAAEPESGPLGMDESHTTLTFLPPLRNTYRRESLIIHANVARATHGETRQEVLGSADAAQPFQQFTLRQSPLTFVPAAVPGGGADTLQIRVNDILWDEASTLYGSRPRDRIYSIRQGPAGNFIIQFGNGVTGARPPSGDENIYATYRVGLGTAGNVKAGQLRVLLSRPLGVRSVNNPQLATGGADPEQAADARLNAACSALTLDRIVTLRDYEDFARAFGGVGKARADWLRDCSSGVICVTVLDARGKALDPRSRQRLESAMTAAHDPAQRFLLVTTDARRFCVRARLVINPHYRVEAVLEKARAALRQAFCLIRRDFGQDLTEGEILGLIQSIDGVIAADMEEPYPGEEWENDHRLLASLGRMTPDCQPAELLLLSEDLDAIALRVVTSLSEPELNGWQS